MQVCQIFSQCADLVLIDEMSTKGIAPLTCCTALIIISYQSIDQTVHRPIHSSMYGIVPPNILHQRQIHIRVDQNIQHGKLSTSARRPILRRQALLITRLSISTLGLRASGAAADDVALINGLGIIACCICISA